MTPTTTPAERQSEWSPADNETFGSAHADYERLRQENPFPWSAEYRAAIDPVFRRASLRPREPAFQASADELVAALLERGEADAVQDFAAPFVVDCFAAVVGVDPEMARHIRTIGVRYTFAIQDMDKAAVKDCSDELYQIAEDVYREQLALDPAPDVNIVASLDRAARDPSTSITEESAIATVRQLIVAGMGAPQAVIGSCIVHLAQDSVLQQHLREHPEDVAPAIEELLRLHSPYRSFARTATEDVTIRGRLVRKGEAVAMLYPSGNRDANSFEDPNTFKLHRKNNSHLGFGRGPHKCPAATMGRTEVAIALRTLLAATDSFELAGEVVMMNWLEYGPRSAPLRLVARASG